MKVEQLCVCERFSVSQDQRITLTEVGDRLACDGFPWQLEEALVVAVKVRFGRHEQGRYNWAIVLLDPEGQAVFASAPDDAVIRVSPGFQYVRLRGAVEFPVPLTLAHEGVYTLCLQLNGVCVQSEPLLVALAS